MNSRAENETRIIILLGIIQQLMTTRTQKLFKSLSITSSEFGLLTHFSHRPDRSWTISELAQVMEMNQPGITKLVASLLDKAALIATTDEFDKRKRHLSITKQGLNLCAEVMQKLQPDISLCFTDWQDEELETFLRDNEKLMSWLDNNRLS
ncbi:MarR family transcriptional regulator [Psychromonas sp. psych-6C06]|uniref:MarR family winged helix-turn-helix transcriptional regulator n=1 Tax=Psychromonas sp. psych-6C06 TaxID=2058089 RepID=UPI000C330539|nr:MarR family winged helix-turn-helix transcriptional regulator [Psychromonas sp. psych-6C06]PKF63433.1 MarR family transcriptional regulator [Psychromonas sp. psych-6C06]